MTRDRGPVLIAMDPCGDCTVLRMAGLVDSTTYLSIRDQVIKAALDEPRAVIVDVSELEVPAGSAWAVFTSARWHVDSWPDVPIILVCGHSHGREAIVRNGVARYLPVYDTVNSAIDAVLRSGITRTRRRARVDLPAHLTSLGRARDLVEDSLTGWLMPDMVAVTKVVVTAFVENVLAHTQSAPNVRLETDGMTIAVAVSDASHTPATIREAVAPQPLTGLQIVASLCRTWGNAPTPTGKTVWAVMGPENRL
jgi:hypothetical protein